MQVSERLEPRYVKRKMRYLLRVGGGVVETMDVLV
jgi:hypothetical protein